MRAPFEIAGDIADDYLRKGREVHPYAAPYVDYLSRCDSWTDDLYGSGEGAMDVLPYLLSNLSTWRGEKAREVKAEIREILKR